MPEPIERIPIACSLTPDNARRQIDEWDELRAGILARERVPGGYALLFDHLLAPRVEEIAAREASCCAFLSITTASQPGGMKLMMTTEDPDALPVIEVLVGPRPSES